MKIGFSFGKCVRDLVEGVVELDDVVVIVSRTAVHNEDHIREMISAYSMDGYLRGANLEKSQEVALELYRTGRIHQPRLFGQYFHQPANEDFVWMDLFPTNNSGNPMVKKAWDSYRMLMRLEADKMPQAKDAKSVLGRE